MILDSLSQTFFLALTSVITPDLVCRVLGEHSLSRLIHLLLVVIAGLSFYLEVRYLNWPLLDLFLAVIIGLLAGLHLVSIFRWRDVDESLRLPCSFTVCLKKRSRPETTGSGCAFAVHQRIRDPRLLRIIAPSYGAPFSYWQRDGPSGAPFQGGRSPVLRGPVPGLHGWSPSPPEL